MKITLQKAIQERDERLKKDADLWTALDETDDADISLKTKTEIKDNNKRIEELEFIIRDEEELRGIREKNSDRQRESNRPLTRLETPASGDEVVQSKAAKGNLGDLVVADAKFNEWLNNVAANGRVTSSKFGNSPAVQLKALLTGGSSTSGGALVQDMFRGLRDGGTWMRELTLFDLISVIPTTSDTVKYVRQDAPTNNAAPVAEATATSGGTGTKPESDMAFTVVTDSIKTIAHWIPVTRQALADVPQLRGLINQFLTYGLREELEDQMIAGSGTGENLTGVLNVTGTTAQAWDTDRLTTTRRARTKVRVTGRARPTAYVMHPNDWEDLDLETDGEERYYFGGPSEIGNPRLWGLPVVENEGMTEGTAVVADWRLAVLYDRQDTQILTSDSHSDFFIRNLIAILAELRAGFGLLRPAAFVEIDLTA